MIGRIMTANTMATVRMVRPVPETGGAKIGIQPRVSTIHASTVERRNGDRTKTPHRPKTTLGMAASSSIMKVSGIATRRGASSAR